MKNYDCKNCEHSKKGSVFHQNRHCVQCVIDSKDLFKDVRPSQFKEMALKE